MNGIITFALRMRALMVTFYVLVIVAGAISFARLNIEAYPDPVPPLVWFRDPDENVLMIVEVPAS